jgi:hypothetical protein
MINKKNKNLKNKLMRYKSILDTYLEYKTPDIPLLVVYRNYVYPKHFISVGTLYTVLNTPIEKQLKELENDV